MATLHIMGAYRRHYGQPGSMLVAQAGGASLLAERI